MNKYIGHIFKTKLLVLPNIKYNKQTIEEHKKLNLFCNHTVPFQSIQPAKLMVTRCKMFCNNVKQQVLLFRTVQLRYL